MLRAKRASTNTFIAVDVVVGLPGLVDWMDAVNR